MTITLGGFQGLGSQGLNPYSYILNNPLAGTDPTGYTAEVETEEVKKVSTGSRIAKKTGEVKQTVSTTSGGVTTTVTKTTSRNGATFSSSSSGGGWEGESTGTVSTVDIGSQAKVSKDNSNNNSSESGTISENFNNNGQISTENQQQTGNHTNAVFEGKGYKLNYSIEGSDEFKAVIQLYFEALENMRGGRIMLRGIARSGKSFLIDENFKVGVGDLEGFDAFLSYSDRAPHRPIGTTAGLRNPTPIMVFAHELHHVWDRVSGGRAIKFGKPVEGLAPRETYAVRYTNQLRKDLKYGYQRNTYVDKYGKKFDIPLR